ncbi:hypothetical protein BHE74_00030866 [Ensete ventricosum]|nr:hypothetical protein BHE74_00030866 [Ensete ventricosum]
MILQASPRHEFIHKKSLFILQAVPNKLYKVRMRQLTQVINLRLQDLKKMLLRLHVSVAANVCSSIHPLKTEPKPPSPNTLSGRKFLVAVLSSLKVKLFRLDDVKISPSLRGVGGTDDADTLLLELLKTCEAPNESQDSAAKRSELESNDERRGRIKRREKRKKESESERCFVLRFWCSV